MPSWQVVNPGSPAAEHTGATRNPDAERGVGRAYRYEANQLPTIQAKVLAREPGVPWEMGKAFTINKDLTGKPGALTVAVRSGNTDPGGIGIAKSNWGIAGLGDAAPAKSNLPLILGSLAALGAIFLFMRKSKS